MLCTILTLYLYVLFARILLSWFPVTPGGGLASVVSVLYSLTEPVLGPLRRAIPPVRLGAAAIDLSPLIVLIGLQLLMASIC
ncbi:MAG: YggT family protein [Actinomycetota bacterium]|nr:YggT family protein [Actinomycetota bacterium]